MAVILLALSALSAAGCGGKGGEAAQRGGLTYTVDADTTVTTGSLGKEGFLARADAICRKSQGLILERFAAYRSEEDKDVDSEKLISGATRSLILPGIQFQFDDLRLTGAPSGDEEQVEEMVGAMQFAIETGERRYVSSATQLGDLFSAFNQLARSYGAGRCTVDQTHYGAVWTAGREKGPASN